MNARNPYDINFKRALMIGLSMLVAMLLSIIPLPAWLINLRPPWALMIIIYWVLCHPQHVGLGGAWLAGLFLDLLQGSLLGEHAFSFTFIAFLTLHFNTRIHQHPFRQQMIIIFLFLGMHQIILQIIRAIINMPVDILLGILPAVAGTLLWPLVYGIMGLLRFERLPPR